MKSIPEILKEAAAVLDGCGDMENQDVWEEIHKIKVELLQLALDLKGLD